MRYNHAMLGETPELFKETEEWVKEEMQRIQKNENARHQINEVLQPLLDKKREKLICDRE